MRILNCELFRRNKSKLALDIDNSIFDLPQNHESREEMNNDSWIFCPNFPIRLEIMLHVMAEC